MKTILFTLSIALILALSLKGDYSGNRKLKHSTFPNPLELKSVSKTESIPADENPQKNNPDWYSEVMNNLSEMEYNISYSEELGTYQSPNRANNIRFIYHKDGFTARTRDVYVPQSREEMMLEVLKKEKEKTKSKEWEITFKVEGLATNSTNSTNSTYLTQFSGSEIKASGNKASIEDENMRIEYTNDKEGMRQDFIIKKRPEGEGKLRLNLSADTKLKMIVGADALMFKDKKGEDRMKYSALKCWDANGRELRAYFKKDNYELQIKNYELESLEKIRNTKFVIPNSFSIVVNDEDAVYPITIDPLSTTPDWSITGNFSFGYSVATAGDVNGDGYSDVIVGAPYDVGKVFGYYGSATGLSSNADWIVTGTVGFGFSVSTAGDVNGDGYSDVIIGNPFYETSPSYENGKVFIYNGSSNGLSLSPNWESTAIGNSYPESKFGYAVSTAGDVNGDGYSEVIIGQPEYSHFQGTRSGSAKLWYGSSTGPGVGDADWITYGTNSEEPDGRYGNSVSTAGDINGDGYSDVIVAEYKYNIISFDPTGKVFVFHGSSAGLSTTSNWQAIGGIVGIEFGYSVSTAGDINGDGYSDVIIGAPRYYYPEIYEGTAFIYYGSAVGLPTPAEPNWIGECNQANALFGASVSAAGDVNGDGYSDIIIGAPFYDNGETDEGKAFTYFGSSSGLSNTPDWTEEINQGNAQYGNSVSLAGDVNGDGYSDVIVGAHLYGGTYSYNGNPTGLSSTSNWTKENNQTDSEFGYNVSAAGDVNRDGYSDVLIGAPFFDNGQTDEGKVFSFYGSSSGLSTSADWTEEINQAGAKFGNSVSTAGDVNGDGYGDVIIGAYKYDNIHTDEGKVFVYHGSSTGLPSSSNWSTYGTQANAKYGYAVSTAGDVNGDGYSDVVVGSPFYDNGQTDEGKAYVFYGSTVGLFLSNWTTESNQAGANLGYSVSSAGDVNGDGFSDLMIGEPNFDDLEFSNKGIALVFHGSHLGLPGTPNWTETRNQSNTGFGSSVSGAGDVNGDGYSDVIIGAPYFDNNTANSGKAFVYHGSESGLGSTTGWNKEGIMANEQLGYSVSNAGDVNGDGYSDVIIGSPFFENGQTFEGRALLFQGSPAGLSINADWTEQSNRTYANFGLSVSSAGDVNGDGYSDVIVGAPGGQVNGQVNVYYGNGGTGLRSNVKQFKPSSSNIVYSGGLTGTDGSVRLNIFGRSPFGRADGKIVYEHKRDGVPFTGDVITNSVSSSGSGNFTDLGVSGVNLNKDISGLPVDHEYKWRARVQYKLTSNPYQKFGPWKYYTNYIPNPFGCFKAQNTPISVTLKTLNLTIFTQGFYDATSNSMVRDTARVYLRYSTSPYAIADSSKAYLTSSGTGTFSFLNSQNNVDYYIVLKHRNSVETWSSTLEHFSSELLTYNFSDAITKAYGSNMIQVDTSPVMFATYGGDVNQDGTVDATDVSTIDNDAANFVSGYVVTDLTGDDFVDGSDFSITDNNAASFVSVVTP
ncbi:MAG: hypothetical protein HGGPFJEG_03123 [Ignavibacteria bacterium]|nr:hypothetical protein [Ignavibacteria bacterium]